MSRTWLTIHFCWFSILGSVLTTTSLYEENNPPKIEWVAETTAKDQNSFGGFRLDGDQIFVGAEDGAIRALNRKTGEVQWTVERQGRAFSPPPCDATRVYFATHHGLTAVSRINGEFDWRFNIEGGAENSILSESKRLIIVGGLDGKIYAVDRETGLEKWRLDILNDAPRPPAGFDPNEIRGERNLALPMGMECDEECVYACIADQGRIVAIELASGKKRWSYQTGNAVYYGPTVSIDCVIIGSRDQHFYCLQKKSGELIWKFKTEGRADQKGVIEKDAFYVGAGDGNFYCINMSDGALRWRFRADNVAKVAKFGIYTMPILRTSEIIFAAQDSTLYSLEKPTGKVRWKFRVDANSSVWKDIAFDGERVYLVLRKNYTLGVGFDPKGINAIVAVTLAH